MSNMTKSKFNPGDRVVYTSWDDTVHGISGTVIEVREVPHHSGIFSGIAYHLVVILDTAEEILDEHGVFHLESEYNPNIPF
mgnify:CR=1 FL=1